MDQLLTQFISALRNADIRISTAETLDALSTVELVGYSDRRLLKGSLRSCCRRRSTRRPRSTRASISSSHSATAGRAAADRKRRRRRAAATPPGKAANGQAGAGGDAQDQRTAQCAICGPRPQQNTQSQLMSAASRQQHLAAAKCPAAIRARSASGPRQPDGDRSPSTPPAGRSTFTRSKCSHRKACTRDGSWMRWVTPSCSRKSGGSPRARIFRIGVEPSISPTARLAARARARLRRASVPAACGRHGTPARGHVARRAAVGTRTAPSSDAARPGVARGAAARVRALASPEGCSVAASCTCREPCAGT